MHGLGELQRRGQLVTTNMCVNERSYRSLPHYPELLKQYGVRQLHVDIVRPESTGERDEAYLRRHHAALLATWRPTTPRCWPASKRGIPTST